MNTKQSQSEFIILMGALMSLVALAIDALLPALKEIGTVINIKDPADSQLLITMIFLGLGIGQLILGPISDSLGRKPIVYFGFFVFGIASIICVNAESLEVMIIGRLLQGIGLSAPRTLCITIIRDSFSGNYMARIMSFVTVIFILVPIVAPAIGKLLLESFGWESIFNSQVIYGVIIMIWFWKRQPETLDSENKLPLSINIFKNGFKEFFKSKDAIIFTLISGLITGAFMVYISASEFIFREQYNLADEFPYIFSGIAVAVGISTFLNGSLVLKFGMFKLVKVASFAFTIIPLLYILLYYNSANPSIYVLITFFTLQFMCIGFLFGNLRALAMEPIGHIAGIGASINGFISTIMAVPIATVIGKYITATTLPLFLGFFVCGGISIGLLYLSKDPKKN